MNEWLEDDRRLWVGCIQDRTLVNTLTVEITTADVNYAGTDDTVTLRLGGRTWHLNNVNRDDFERGNTEHVRAGSGHELLRGRHSLDRDQQVA